VLTNFIQLDVASSGPTAQSTLPFQIAGPGSNNFASTLLNAAKTGSPPPEPTLPARRLDEATAVAGQGKRAEKKTASLAKATMPTPVPLTLAPAAPDAEKATIPSVIARLQPMPSPVPMPSLVVAESFATRGSIPLQPLSARSNASAGLISEADSTKPGVSSASLGEFQNSVSSTPTLGSGKPMPRSDPASPPSADAAVKQVIPLPAGEVRPLLTTPKESVAAQRSDAEPSAAGPSVANEFAGIASSNLAVSDAPTQSPSPPIAQYAEVPRDSGPSPAPTTLTQSAMPLAAVVPTYETANLAFTANQPSSDNKPQTVNSDFVPPAITPNGIPQQEVDPTRDAAIAIAGINQPPADSKPQSGNGPGIESLDAAASSFSLAVSSMPSPAEISKPISMHAGMAVKAAKTAPAADARPKETPASSGPSSPETKSSKPADSSANPADANTQPQSPVAAPAAFAVRMTDGGMTDGNQPGTVATANVLAQVPPAANQAAESPVATSPAADSASPAASGPPALPASTVEVARLVTGVAQSEMHIGLRTQAFGNVEVHTVVRDSQVGVSVGSERGDLRSLFAPEVSGLQNTFRQQDLRFDSIRFLENGAGTTAGFSGGSNSQARSSNQQHSSPAGLFSIHGPPEDSVELDLGAEIRAKLNVHA
jgi:hypothetical protein